MNKDIKNIIEILELVADDLKSNNENISAVLDYEDLKSLQNLYNLYKNLKEENEQNSYILKQKIKDKIEYLDKNYSEFSEYPIGKTKQVMQELLEEE